MNLQVKYAPWEISTGASSGIGKSMAFVIAQKGINPVLISSNQKYQTNWHNKSMFQVVPLATLPVRQALTILLISLAYLKGCLRAVSWENMK